MLPLPGHLQGQSSRVVRRVSETSLSGMEVTSVAPSKMSLSLFPEPNLFLEAHISHIHFAEPYCQPQPTTVSPTPNFSCICCMFVACHLYKNCKEQTNYLSPSGWCHLKLSPCRPKTWSSNLGSPLTSWVSLGYITTQCLNFQICKRGVLVPISRNHCEN